MPSDKERRESMSSAVLRLVEDALPSAAAVGVSTMNRPVRLPPPLTSLLREAAVEAVTAVRPSAPTSLLVLILLLLLPLLVR